ncbi:hypothetical protein M407DRAFT_81841 [Tulasnella calospora MUT 4182]|uniref:Uncharacterized protein n=1 Tax=Tulasnella calospora MUT 4182 TaxID=1051891 RepID=A0A0C3Q7W1_9AGAM|nr:hypothetical protein M407DRAFT_81841 [Tulasnella calospora MUT 4182]
MTLKAVKSLGRALKRGIPVERRKLRKYSWLPDVLRIEGSIIRRIVGPVLTVTLFAGSVVVCSEVYGYHLNLSNNVVPLLSVVVGLILVFRNGYVAAGICHDRYYEARKDFAALTSTVRNLSRLIWVQVVMQTEDGDKPAPTTFATFLRAGSPLLKAAPGTKPNTELTTAQLTAMKIRAIKLLLSFVYSVMHHLRNEPGTEYEDYEGVLPEAMDRGHLGYAPNTKFRRHPSFKGSMGSQTATNGPNSQTPLLEGDHATVEGSHATVEFHPRSTPASLPLPLIIAHDLQRIIYSFKRKGLLDPLGPAGFNAMNQFICGMVEQLTAMERVATTPIPISYGIHLKQCVTLYLFSLPFTLVHDMHWTTIPLVTLVAFTLMGIEGIANEIEMPFGRDGKSSADLPLERYCEALRSEMEYMIERLPEGPEDEDPYEEEEQDD